MFIRAYLRASTEDQNAERAKQQLIDFAASHGHRIAAFYIENASGATLDRPELARLIADSSEGDVLLIEQVDRLTRLSAIDWDTLKARITGAGVTVVSCDLPTSHAAMTAQGARDEFTRGMMQAVNSMLLEMLSVIGRKDYEDRRRRQAQGIDRAKAQGKYVGRPADTARHESIRKMLASGMSYSEIQKAMGCGRALIAKVKAGG